MTSNMVTMQKKANNSLTEFFIKLLHFHMNISNMKRFYLS